MSEQPLLPSDEIARQLRQHAESLRLAGVEWVPASRLTATPPTAPGESLPPDTDFFGTLDNAHGQDVAPDPADLDARRQSLEVLAEQVSGCRKCAQLAATRKQTVFGVGPVGAELCFIGEAPGADEDAQGEPFVGEAGQLLNKIIAACQMRREEVYICNILKCRPPNNRTPLPDEAANCRGFLEEQLRLIRPKFICALGSTAAQHLLGTTLSIGKLRGRFHDYRGTPVLCTYHPAYLLPHRSPERKKDVWEDMKMLLRRMGRAV